MVYPSDPRHSTASVDYGEDGYSYTNAGELARYDLDQDKSSRPRRRESIDRGYYRPNVNYNSDQRTLNVEPSKDLSRNYHSNTSRPYEGVTRGPPPSTRGFDRIGRAYDDSRDVPPAAPAPPTPTTASQPDAPGASTTLWPGGRRGSRPVSLYQEFEPARSSHHEDYYRSRDDERAMREMRDHDPQPSRDESQFQDEKIPSRGFGIKTDLLENREGLLDAYRRSDEKIEQDDRRRRRQEIQGDRQERREGRRGSDDDEKDKARLRDKVAATGFGVAASAVGLAASKDDAKSERETSRRHSPPDDRRGPEERDKGRLEKDRDGEAEREHDRGPDREKDAPRDELAATERNRRDAEARLTGEPARASPSSDEDRRPRRRRGASQAFDPNNADDLKQVREQLAALNAQDKYDKDSPKAAPEALEPPRDYQEVDRSRDESRGREVGASSSENRQVRLVSPPRDKRDDKPLKSILKQPSARFPEETNPIREGVAPHKDDKKLKDAPVGAKWTKISRKVVNPEALSIGKERFEIRDDFVIVLRVLSKEEIQAYASATQVLRGMRYGLTPYSLYTNVHF